MTTTTTEQELKAAAINYGKAFAETDPKAESERRTDAHARLVRAARRYEASQHLLADNGIYKLLPAAKGK